RSGNAADERRLSEDGIQSEIQRPERSEPVLFPLRSFQLCNEWNTGRVLVHGRSRRLPSGIGYGRQDRLPENGKHHADDYDDALGDFGAEDTSGSGQGTSAGTYAALVTGLSKRKGSVRRAFPFF